MMLNGEVHLLANLWLTLLLNLNSFASLLTFHLCQVPYLAWPTYIEINPTKGALGVDVELPKKWVTFAKYYMQPYEQHLATQYTKVICYPPLGSLAC